MINTKTSNTNNGNHSSLTVIALLLQAVILLSNFIHVSTKSININNNTSNLTPRSATAANTMRSLQNSQRDILADVYAGLNLPIANGRECLWKYVVCESNTVIKIIVPPLPNPDQLTTTLSTRIGQLISLTRLSINNYLIGTIPSEIGNLRVLKTLYLNGYYAPFAEDSASPNLVDTNKLTGSIPLEIGNLQLLSDIYLANNSLTGTIPQGSIDTIKRINLDHNSLTGTIPMEWGEMNSLDTISLNGNKISGTFPSQLFQVIGLKYLSLTGNQLVGTIPSGWPETLFLANLYMNRNQFTGTIPTELGGMGSLWLIDLSDNQLTGTIPMELGHIFGPITYLDISNNDLSGSYTHLCQIATFHMDNNDDLRGNCNGPISAFQKFSEIFTLFFDIETALDRLETAFEIVSEDPSAFCDAIKGFVKNSICNEDLNGSGPLRELFCPFFESKLKFN